MKELTVTDLVLNIFDEIEKRNKRPDNRAIPETDEFYPYLEKKFNIRSDAIEILLEVLVNSHKIFSFEIISEDKKKYVNAKEGFVISEINVIRNLLNFFEKELVRLYFENFEVHLSPMKIVKAISGSLKEYNNTPFGRVANIVVKLVKFEEILKVDYAYVRDARKFSPEWKEKKFEEEVEKCPQVEELLKSEKKPIEEKNSKDVKINNKRRRSDTVSDSETIINTFQKSIEKSLAVYGVEFYTRICFREYKFNLMVKIVAEKFVNSKNDLLIIKDHIKRVRSHSDRDMKLQKFAKEINRLERLVNERLKS